MFENYINSIMYNAIEEYNKYLLQKIQEQQIQRLNTNIPNPFYVPTKKADVIEHCFYCNIKLNEQNKSSIAGCCNTCNLWDNNK